jgi:uncharacterized protein YndB with AHSA1/START domain
MTQQDVPTARRGVVTTEPDGRRRLVFRRSWPDPVEDVWAALTEPERLARWIGRYDGERGPAATGTFTMTHEQEPGSQAVHILECDPPRRLVLEWSLGEDPWRVELDLSTDGTTTTLVFTQAFRAGFPVADVAGGWHWYLDKLDAEVTGGEGPDEWEPFWAQVGPLYGGGASAG